MNTIRPVSDLRNNFADISKTVHETSQPVFLTKNGRGKYVIIDIDEFEKTKATLRLLSELSKGEESAKKDGWLSFDEVLSKVGLANG